MTMETMAYPKVEPQPRFPRLEERVSDRWRERSTFFESIARREAEGADEFVFYDGPPFANGLPHYGHLLTGYVKDAVPRYKTIRGYVVHRRFGWDCHGLPAEVEAERRARNLRSSRDHRLRHRGLQRSLPAPASCATRPSGSATSSARPDGSTSRTIDPQAIELGRQLTLKDRGLDCRQCHTLDRSAVLQEHNAQGIGFLEVKDRMRYEFYRRWVLDPLRIDPGTEMPKFAADGETTTVKHIYDGQARPQFDALWQYIQSLEATSRTTPTSD